MGNALSYFFGAHDEAPAPTTTTREPKPLIVANADVGTLDVEEMSRALKEAVRQTPINEDRCNDILTRLEGVKISYSTIKATGLGLAVHAVRKAPSVSVVLAAKAKRLRAKWKDGAEKKLQQEMLKQQQMLKKRKQQKKNKQPKGAKQQQKLKQPPQVQASTPQSTPTLTPMPTRTSGVKRPPRTPSVHIPKIVGPIIGVSRGWGWKKVQAAHDQLGFKQKLKVRLALDTNIYGPLGRKAQYRSAFGPMSPQRRNRENHDRWKDWQRNHQKEAKQINTLLKKWAYAENEEDA